MVGCCLFLSFFFKYNLFLFMCMDVLLVYMSVYHLYGWYPQKLEEGIKYLRTRVTDRWLLNPPPMQVLGSLEEQPLLFFFF